MALMKMPCAVGSGSGIDFDEIAFVGTHNGYTGDSGVINVNPNYLANHSALVTKSDEQIINVTGECATYVCQTRYGGYIDVTAVGDIKVTAQTTVNSNITTETVNLTNGQTQRFSTPSSSSGDYAYKVLYVKGM